MRSKLVMSTHEKINKNLCKSVIEKLINKKHFWWSTFFNLQYTHSNDISADDIRTFRIETTKKDKKSNCEFPVPNKFFTNMFLDQESYEHVFN